jgi:hypothetical protein
LAKLNTFMPAKLKVAVNVPTNEAIVLLIECLILLPTITFATSDVLDRQTVPCDEESPTRTVSLRLSCPLTEPTTVTETHPVPGPFCNTIDDTSTTPKESDDVKLPTALATVVATEVVRTTPALTLQITPLSETHPVPVAPLPPTRDAPL